MCNASSLTFDSMKTLSVGKLSAIFGLYLFLMHLRKPMGSLLQEPLISAHTEQHSFEIVHAAYESSMRLTVFQILYSRKLKFSSLAFCPFFFFFGVQSPQSFALQVQNPHSLGIWVNVQQASLPLVHDPREIHRLKTCGLTTCTLC